ncbi:TPA: hypothetical protein HA265_08575 [Candidatus Woesearchaeota archaeon]|nr:hypothetical protein [Candidatus Woesearchaeota archaeon]
MKESSPISAEIRRQQQQGFMENKTGWITPELGFQIKYCPADAGRVIVTQAGLFYRNEVPGNPFHISHLAELPAEAYAPMHHLFESLTRELGRGGVARISRIVGGDLLDSTHPKNSAMMPVEEALDQYRHGSFEYVAPRGEKAYFWAHDVKSRAGTLSVDLPFRTIDDLEPAHVGNLVGLIEQIRREQK